MRRLFKPIPINILLIVSVLSLQAQPVRIALLKYNGGGDWYANPTSLPNLIEFCNKNIGTNINPEPATVDVGSAKLFNYPFVHLTGHGNIVFSESDVLNLRNYLAAGGFLHIDNNYGIEQYVRREMKKVLPDQEFIELPFSHAIYHTVYQFDNGLPKIHEHDNLPPQGFGLFIDGRLVCFFSHECDLGDGWEDPSVHNDPMEKHIEALQMGANIVSFVFSH
ncbi:MAG: DUF4159 domain-containing protein [Salinivirgaceae bacterium]|nr:DUF4159 domain-containing protein [Salinivirgaceae bacterium]